MINLLQSISNLHSIHKLWISACQLVTLLPSVCEFPSDCDINIPYNGLSEEYHFKCIGEANYNQGY